MFAFEYTLVYFLRLSFIFQVIFESLIKKIVSSNQNVKSKPKLLLKEADINSCLSLSLLNYEDFSLTQENHNYR